MNFSFTHRPVHLDFHLNAYISAFYLFFLFTTVPNLIYGQTKSSDKELKALNKNQASGIVKGKMTDAQTRQPIEYASVVIYREKDSSMVTGVITNNKGVFILENIPFGKFFVKLNYIGYKPQKLMSVIITQNKPVNELGIINFKPEYNKLDEVTISAEKPLIEYSLDKKVVNVEKNITTTGGTVVDVLQQIPSVTVDVDGNVSLRGNTNVTVLIDGRQSSMTTARLQQIPASQVESIELITNPSAKYNPDGMAGIVNIKLKTSKEKGFNGLLLLNAGTGSKSNGDFDINKYNSSLNLNWKYKKLNLFGSWDARNNQSSGKGFSYRSTSVMDTLSILRQDGKMFRQMNSNSIKAGGDYMFNTFNLLSVSALYNFSTSNHNYIATTSEIDMINNTNSFYKLESPENSTSNSTDITINYKKTFDKKDKLFNVDAIISIDREDESEGTIRNYYNPSDMSLLPDETVDQKATTNSNNKSATLNINYANPVNENMKIETGYQSILNQTDDDYKYLLKDFTSGAYKEDAKQGNIFQYDLQIYSAYGILSGNYKKFSYNTGLRFEQAYTTGMVKTPVSNTFTQNYFNIFPSAFLTRKIDETQSIQISYSRRVNRPNMHQLNPFRDVANPNYIRYGNPQLKPEYIDSYELGYLKYLMNKNTISADLFYKQINNVIKYYTYVLNSQTTENTFINLSTGKSYGVDLIADFQIIKGWRANANFSFFRTEIKGSNQNNPLSNSNYSWTGKFNTTINLPKKFTLQVNANYRGAMVNPQGEMRPSSNVDFALKKDIFKEKVSLSFRISDIFNQQKFFAITNQPGLYSENSRKRESRVAYLSLTYKLNYDQKAKQPKKEQNQNNGGGEDMEF